MLSAFLGGAMVLLGVGMLAVAGFGNSAADGATMLLGVAVFLTLFSLLLLFPRLRRRGARSFGRIVDRPLPEVETVVRAALEETGRPVRVESLRSRSKRAARLVRVEGLPSLFVIEPFAGPARKMDGSGRTEIVQVGVAGESDSVAKGLRDLIEAQLQVGDDRAS